MLGDSLPLFFPVLIFSLCLWLVADKVDNYCRRFSPLVESRLKRTYRIVPILMVAWLMISRARAIITRDTKHVEVANRLGDSNYAFSDLILLISGDGVGEFALLLLLIFSLWTVNLPSMRKAPYHIRKAVQNKVMLYVSACALLTFWIFFPESNYYSPDSFPIQPTMSSNGDYAVVLVIATTLMVAFSAELFAISSLQQEEDFIVLKKRALLKTYLVSAIVLIGFYFGDYFEFNWVSGQVDEKVIATLILFSQALILAFICVPGKHSDNLLRVGEARTKSFAIMSLLTLAILILITSFMLQNTTEYSTGNRYLEESLWLTASFTIMLSITQILPRYGFDGAARPEYWWLRITILFAPALIYWFNHLAIFIIPALWCVASLTIVLPNLIEQDAKSPSKQGIGLIIGSMILILIITSATANMLGYFILFGSTSMIISNVTSQLIPPH